MFGYVKPYNSELKVREDEYYRGIYCGLCRSLSKNTGGFSSIILSYDMTFFAIVRMALKGMHVKMKKRRCLPHPFRKHTSADDNEELKYAAYCSVVLAHMKVKDNISDERSLKKAASILASPFTSIMSRRAKEKFVTDTIQKGMNVFSALEDEKCQSIDAPADAFGQIFSELMSYKLEGNAREIAKDIGLHVGKWVYFADARCDYRKDLKNNSYNPFIYAFDSQEKAEQFFNDEFNMVMSLELNRIKNDFELIDRTGDPELYACAENIILAGMKNTLNREIEKEKNS